MRVIISGIRPNGPHGAHIIDMLIDDEPKSFEIEVVPPWFTSMRTRPDFDDYFEQTFAMRDIGPLVDRFHKGEQVDFPLDLGEIVRFDTLTKEQLIALANARRRE